MHCFSTKSRCSVEIEGYSIWKLSMATYLSPHLARFKLTKSIILALILAWFFRFTNAVLIRVGMSYIMKIVDGSRIANEIKSSISLMYAFSCSDFSYFLSTSFYLVVLFTTSIIALLTSFKSLWLIISLAVSMISMSVCWSFTSGRPFTPSMVVESILSTS